MDEMSFDDTVSRGTFEAVKNAPGLGSVVISPQGKGVIIDEKMGVGNRKRFTIVPYDNPEGEPVDVDATNDDATNDDGTTLVEKMDLKELDEAILQTHIDALDVRIRDRESSKSLVPDGKITGYLIHTDHLKTAKKELARLRDKV